MKITGPSTLPISHSWEWCFCWSRSIVRQSNHFTTVLRTSEFTQVSPFPSTVAKDHFSWCTFLNVWKRLLFAGDGFAGAQSIDSAMLSLKHETSLQMALWFQRSIQLTALRMRCSLWKTSEKLFFLHGLFRTHAEHFCEQICIFLSFTHAQQIQKWLR